MTAIVESRFNNLSSTQKLVYALRKRFFKHLMKSRRAFMVLSQLFISYKQNQSISLWRPTFNMKSGVLASAKWPRKRHDMRSMYIVALMTSGKRSWPQERLVLKLSNINWVELRIFL